LAVSEGQLATRHGSQRLDVRQHSNSQHSDLSATQASGSCFDRHGVVDGTRAFGCANGSTRQELFGIRTEDKRPKFFAVLKLGTAKPLPAASRTVITAFETLANASGTVVGRAK
jgi:hypothetical protein